MSEPWRPRVCVGGGARERRADTLGRVMADGTLREALAAHARADAAAFSPEAAAERWDALLRHLLAAGTPRLGP